MASKYKDKLDFFPFTAGDLIERQRKEAKEIDTKRMQEDKVKFYKNLELKHLKIRE